MKRLLLLLIIGMFLITLVNAESIGTAKQYQEMQITNYCQSGDCTSANLTTITYPNGTVKYINSPMTQVGNDFNYTYTPMELGIYNFKTCSNPNGETICDSDTFEVTPSGFTGTLGFYILILALSFGIILLGFYKSDAPIVIFGSFGLYFVGLYILFYGIDGLKDATYTWAIGIIVLMLAAYISIRSSYELITN